MPFTKDSLEKNPKLGSSEVAVETVHRTSIHKAGKE